MIGKLVLTTDFRAVCAPSSLHDSLDHGAPASSAWCRRLTQPWCAPTWVASTRGRRHHRAGASCSGRCVADLIYRGGCAEESGARLDGPRRSVSASLLRIWMSRDEYDRDDAPFRMHALNTLRWSASAKVSMRMRRPDDAHAEGLRACSSPSPGARWRRGTRRARTWSAADASGRSTLRARRSAPRVGCGSLHGGWVHPVRRRARPALPRRDPRYRRRGPHRQGARCRTGSPQTLGEF